MSKSSPPAPRTQTLTILAQDPSIQVRGKILTAEVVLVAAVMNAFVDVWADRLRELRRTTSMTVNRDRAAEEGAGVADRLLTMCIRALDYCPPLHIEFGDFVSALLTADYEIRTDDTKYQFRKLLREKFGAYGISPASAWRDPEVGLWKPPGLSSGQRGLNVSRSHLEPLQRDPDEVFRPFQGRCRFSSALRGVAPAACAKCEAKNSGRVELMPGVRTPSELVIRAYQVGFGDCCLLTFVYPAVKRKKAFKRHALIDFGSTAAPKVFGEDLLKRVAEDVRSECDGKLDLVVASHRHGSAVNGFDRRAGKEAPGEIIRGCKPDLVLMPWTENPAMLGKVQSAPKKPSRMQQQVRAYSKLMRLLERVEFYKTGDHGSGDGTPKPLLDLFQRRPRSAKRPSLQSVVSTMAARHRLTDRGAEAVPQHLVNKLKAKGDFFSTQVLKKKNELKRVFRITV